MEVSRLYTWAITTRVTNEERGMPCAQTAAFLHSEVTATFDLNPGPQGPFCLLHAQHPAAYRYVPRNRVAALLEQAREARDQWTTQLIIHKGQPPTERWKKYQGGLSNLAAEVARVSNDLLEALAVLEKVDPYGATTADYATIVDQLAELLGEVDGAPPTATSDDS